MNLPVSFVDSARRLLGDVECESFIDALSQPAPVSVRINPLKAREGVLELERVPWASGGYYLGERLTFTFDPLFHAGCYYVQEASSMFVEQVVRRYVTDPVVALDLCAAPGGKTTHLRSTLPEGSLLVANEVIKSRVRVLTENIVKWGHPDVVVTNSDPADFGKLSSFFDVILVDAPCSGEGMFRKDPEAVEAWSLENVEVCWQRQRRIVADVWPSLKPGGVLIYSTCTYNRKEDEENARWMRDELGAELLPVEVPEAWGITGNRLEGEDFPVYRFLPHRTKGEGFFLTAARKPEEAEEDAPPKKRKDKRKEEKGKSAAAGKAHLKMAGEWMSDEAGEYALSADDEGSVWAFPCRYADELDSLRRRLKVVYAGVSVGEVKGRDLIPSHALAMCPALFRKEAFPTEEVDYGQAVAYLRREAVTLSAAAPRGYVLLTYRGVPLGFVKNIGNRSNNLYPQEWRIRSGYTPEEVKTLPL